MIPYNEQETTITYDQGEKIVRIYTARPPDINKLRKAGIKPVGGDTKSGYRYHIPMDRLSWRIRKAKEDRSRIPSNMRGLRPRKGTPGEHPLHGKETGEGC